MFWAILFVPFYFVSGKVPHSLYAIKKERKYGPYSNVTQHFQITWTYLILIERALLDSEITVLYHSCAHLRRGREANYLT